MRYKWEVYRDTNGRSTDSTSLSSKRRGTKSTAIQIGGVLRYIDWRCLAILFWRSGGGWGFRHSSGLGCLNLPEAVEAELA